MKQRNKTYLMRDPSRATPWDAYGADGPSLTNGGPVSSAKLTFEA
jgi:hypothetical protein